MEGVREFEELGEEEVDKKREIVTATRGEVEVVPVKPKYCGGVPV